MLFQKPEYPTVDYPTIIDGFVGGDKLRLESLSGEERYLNFFDIPVKTIFHAGSGFRLRDCKPLSLDGMMWGVTHLQKYSRWGYLKVSPDCYHRWYFWRTQQKDASGNWLPGTERGLYFRKPFSWRWDVAGTEGKHWIWTKGFLGGHFD